MNEINLLILDLNVLVDQEIHLVRQKLEYYEWYITGIGECDLCNKDDYFQSWEHKIPELKQIYLVQEDIDGNLCHQYDCQLKNGYSEHCSYAGLLSYCRPGIGAVTLIIKDHQRNRDLKLDNKSKLPIFRMLLVSEPDEFSVDQTSIPFIDKKNWLSLPT